MNVTTARDATYLGTAIAVGCAAIAATTAIVNELRKPSPFFEEKPGMEWADPTYGHLYVSRDDYKGNPSWHRVRPASVEEWKAWEAARDWAGDGACFGAYADENDHRVLVEPGTPEWDDILVRPLGASYYRIGK